MPNAVTTQTSASYVYGLKDKIAKGVLQNHRYATNFSMAFFQNPNAFASKSIFPTIPVDLDVGKYIVFDREDLARVNAAKKPQAGMVQGFTVSNHEELYSVDVYQTRLLFDMINQTRIDRSGVVGASNVMQSRAKIVAEQLAILQDILFADKFFKSGVWGTEYTGADSNPTGNQFYKFSDANFEPIKFFNGLKREMLEKTGRRPNKLLLGLDAYDALCECPALLDRINGNSSKDNPSILNDGDLARLLGFQKIAVFEGSYNAAPIGQQANYKFIADPTAALVCYSPDSPMIDEPSCGYSFTWDMLGNRNYAPVFVHDSNDASHTSEMEALLATSHKKTCDDLGIFLSNCADKKEAAGSEA